MSLRPSDLGRPLNPDDKAERMIETMSAVQIAGMGFAVEIPEDEAGMSGSGAVPNSPGPGGLNLEVRFVEGMDREAFERKLGQLRFHIDEGNAFSNLPHGVRAAERRAVTRAYRRDLESRIGTFFREDPLAGANALERLRQSDIDHILDLQLDGENVRSNVKALHSFTNQSMGSQIGDQLPVNRRVRILGIREVK
jgi:hypothetical protein